MSECKRIITPNSICTESALDAVCKLVATGMKVTPACKFVAAEYQKNYPEDRAEWETLKKQYYRSSTTVKSDKKQGHVPVSKQEEKTGTCPCLTTEPYVSMEVYTKAKAYIKELEERIKNLEYYNELLNTELLKSMGIETPPQKSVVEEAILLTRTEMIDIISTYGTGFQPMVLKKDKVSNRELFNTVLAIRTRFEENKSTIPNPLPKIVMLANNPEPEEDIGTLKSLPRSDIKI